MERGLESERYLQAQVGQRVERCRCRSSRSGALAVATGHLLAVGQVDDHIGGNLAGAGPVAGPDADQTDGRDPLGQTWFGLGRAHGHNEHDLTRRVVPGDLRRRPEKHYVRSGSTGQQMHRQALVAFFDPYPKNSWDLAQLQLEHVEDLSLHEGHLHPNYRLPPASATSGTSRYRPLP